MLFEQKVAEIAEENEYYLIFGKQTDSEGVYTRIWVEVKLPVSRNFECLNESQKEGLLLELEMILNHNLTDPFEYVNKEIEAMGIFEKFVLRAINCCGSYNVGEKTDVNPELINIVLCVDNGCQDFEEGEVALISSTPTMPEISFRLEYDEEGICSAPFNCSLKIYYKRSSRNDEVTIDIGEVEFGYLYFIEYPEIEKWGETWDIIQGGRAELIVNDVFGEFVKSFDFSIKGQNPQARQVYEFLDDSPYSDLWFLKKMVTHESASYLQSQDSPMEHFNEKKDSKEDLWVSWDEYSRCTKFANNGDGGWGMMQLTNPPPDKLSMWNWKAMIHEAYYLLTDKTPTNYDSKYRWVIKRMTEDPEFHLQSIKDWNAYHESNPVSLNENYGGITWKAAMTPLFRGTALDGAFKETMQNGDRSVLDACLIHLYNSGAPNEIYLRVFVPADCGNPPCKPVLSTVDNSRNYVRQIAEQTIPQY